ncbi:unnamed protein product [Phyllotreta striolata]|uniref:Cx9C motif-containing protein 4 n=1 Tax=Phyllotreta striolata TaxID=444603 RepID=A0A9N9XNL0_PHYSR|nr:unnamed protein product [Phyllotreta striolata]
MSGKDPCKPFACRIQVCLRENNFQESKCTSVINDMKECCRKWKNLSYVCQGMNLDTETDDQNERQRK